MIDARTAPFILRPELGGRVERCRIGYRLDGPRPGLPATSMTLVMGGISADRRVRRGRSDDRSGWWEWAVGPRRPVDTRDRCVLSIDWLGGPGDSTGAWVGGRDRDRVPLLTTNDHADAIASLLDHLEVDRLEAVVGSSFGGCVGLALASRHPDRVERLLVIGAAEAPHPLATAVRVIQRRIVQEAVRSGSPRRGLALARALAITTYRTDREFDARFGGPVERDGTRIRFPVESYLDHNAARFTEAFTAEQFLCLSGSLDLHQVDPERVRCPVTLVALEGDRVAPPWQVSRLAARLATSTLIEIDSLVGHDAFLADPDRIGPVLERFLDRVGVAA